ncbi:hypothetical protein Tco_0545288 [Tanacetum coccineum]
MPWPRTNLSASINPYAVFRGKDLSLSELPQHSKTLEIADVQSREQSNTRKRSSGISDIGNIRNPSPAFDPIVANSISRPYSIWRKMTFYIVRSEQMLFLALDDYTTSPEVDPTYMHPTGTFFILEAFS